MSPLTHSPLTSQGLKMVVGWPVTANPPASEAVHLLSSHNVVVMVRFHHCPAQISNRSRRYLHY